MHDRKTNIVSRLSKNYIPILIRQRKTLLTDLWIGLRLVWRVGFCRRELLVIERRPPGIGDLICLFASVPGLRQRNPRAWVLFIVAPASQRLAQTIGLADAVTMADGVLDRVVRRLCPAKSFLRPALPDELQPARPRPRIHLADEFANHLGVNAQLDAVRLNPPPGTRFAIQKRLAKINPQVLPLVVVQPGPTWPVKSWPDASWLELGRGLAREFNVLVIQVGVDVDSFTREVRCVVRVPGSLDWVNQLDLVETSALLAGAHLFIGPDSGPIHLATTLGVPTIGLFGPTDGNCFVHPRAKTKILTGAVTCLGCHHAASGPLHWRTGCPFEIKCMQAITVESVLQTCRLMLPNARPING